MLRCDVAVGGEWLAFSGQVTDAQWSTRWGSGPCGADIASCNLTPDSSLDARWMRPRAPMEIYDEAGVRRYAGRLLSGATGLPRKIEARGLAHLAADFDAVDSSGEPTTNARTAVTQAIARGLPWSNPTVFPNSSIGVEGAPSMQRLNVLLDQVAASEARRWGVDDYGRAFWATDPTTPTWFLDARDLEIGTADDGLYTRVRARYVSSVDGTTGEPDGWSTVVRDDLVAQAEYGVIEYGMDLTGLGLISSGAAGGFAESQLAQLTVPQWLSRIAATSGYLVDGNGQPADLQAVRAGQMVRLFNVPNSLGGLRRELNLNVVLGEVAWSEASPDEVTLAPVNIAVASVADQAAATRKMQQRMQGVVA